MKLTSKKASAPEKKPETQKSDASKSNSAPTKKPTPEVKAKKAEPQELEERIGYLIQCAPGLAQVLQKELNFAGATTRDQKMFVKLQRNHDLTFLNHVKSEEGLPRLRTAEMVLRCPAYGRFKISQRQLGLMAEELKSKGPRRLVVSVAGKTFTRQDLARFLTKAMSERGYDFDEDVEDEVWMFCIDESWYFGLPLFKARTQRESGGASDFEDEGSHRREERQGSLPPTIAAAMAFAAMPKNDDIALDPTCGSGTLLTELHAYAPEAQLIGCDIDANAVKIATKNVRGNSQILNLDSRKLSEKLKSTSASHAVGKVSLTLSNLPFGVQFGDRASNPALYKDILTESLKVADPERNWRGVFLTSDTESFEKALREVSGLAKPEIMFKVKIRGELATCYRLKTV